MSVVAYDVTYANGTVRTKRLSSADADELERRAGVVSVERSSGPRGAAPRGVATGGLVPSSDPASPAERTQADVEEGDNPQPEGSEPEANAHAPEASPKEAERVADEDEDRAAETAGTRPGPGKQVPPGDLAEHEEPATREGRTDEPEDADKEHKQPKRRRSARDKQAQRARDK